VPLRIIILIDLVLLTIGYVCNTVVHYSLQEPSYTILLCFIIVLPPEVVQLRHSALQPMFYASGVLVYAMDNVLFAVMAAIFVQMLPQTSKVFQII